MTATVGIDPRIQARRTAVRRGEGHRRLRRLQAVGVVLVAFAISFVITLSPAMDVDHIRIAADGVEGDVVRDALGVSAGQPMTGVDPQAAADAVAALPTVESVDVRRAWPNSIVVDVTGRVPAVVIASAGGGWLVADDSGAIVATAETAPADLVRGGSVELSGRPGQLLPDAYRPVAAVAAALPQGLRDQTEQVVIGDLDRIEVVLSGGGKVVFAADGDHREAAASAEAVFATVPPGCVELIDVVSPSAPVLRRSPLC